MKIENTPGYSPKALAATGSIKPTRPGKLLLLLLIPSFGLATLTSASDVISVWGGARGTIVLKSDGTVWTWGANGAGKLD